ncbi:MAG: helix-turn-helix transcriptional regulator [Clostridia bacterium]|nr:helix-turn-helix transcriptional regulator [Clostridia bacterium]
MSKPRRNPLGKRNIVGEKITLLRKQKGLKQKELAARLQSMGMDISESSLSRLECQERLVQDFELPILAKALGITVAELLQEDE